MSSVLLISFSPVYISFFKSVLVQENISYLPNYPFLFRSLLKNHSLQMSIIIIFLIFFCIIINLSGKRQLFILSCYI